MAVEDQRSLRMIAFTTRVTWAWPLVRGAPLPGCSLFRPAGMTQDTAGRVPSAISRNRSAWSRILSRSSCSWVVVKEGSGFCAGGVPRRPSPRRGQGSSGERHVSFPT
ncbi:hypothetical protein HRbin12_01473 [bacterium HR12]|nr:hypothetical protein HRbin12_01473 [bacterium HR12]